MALTKEVLSFEFDWLIGLPRDLRKGKAYEVVSAIFNSIKAALLRGESVKILGFGTFKVIEVPARKRELSLTPGRKRWLKTDYRELVTIPPAKKAVFIPFNHLVRYVNS